VKYIDNKQLGVSLLNGVVFKIFFLEPAVKWEPNKLSVLLRISNLGTKILFIGVLEKKKKRRFYCKAVSNRGRFIFCNKLSVK